MNHDSYSDAYIRDILVSHRSVAMVGASPKPSRPSYFVLKYLLARGFDVVPVNPGHAGKQLLGQEVFGALGDIDRPIEDRPIEDRPIEIVDIFRNSDAALSITQDAIAIGAKVVWMQLGVRNDEAAQLAETAGLKVVMNRCPKIEYARLTGEIGWMGVNSRVLSSKRPLLSNKGVQKRALRPTK